MKHYLNLDAIPDLQSAIDEVIDLKNNPYAAKDLGRQKNLRNVIF
jgi:hypothetical protein